MGIKMYHLQLSPDKPSSDFLVPRPELQGLGKLTKTVF